MRRLLLLAALGVALIAVPGASAVTGYYSFTWLGSFTPQAINHSGMVVGMPYAVWSPDRGLAYLPLLAPSDVNDDGVVVGGMNAHAYSWTESGGLVDLGQGEARAISNNGLIAGSDLRHPVLWTAGGKVDLFGESADTGVATGVGTSGRVVGYGHTAAGETYLFTWTSADGVTVLANLGTYPSASIFVNDRGDVAGTSMGPWGPAGFFWTRDGGLVDLGVLIPFGQTSVNGLGSDGTVIGSSLAGAGFPPAQHPFFWTPARGLVDLGTLGGKRGFASGIAADGTVGGWTMITGSYVTHAFVWTQHYGMLDLGFDPTESSMVYAVSDQGWLVGTSGGSAYLWKPRDVTPPVITVPQDITAEATSADGAIVTFTVTAVDNLDPNPVITCMHESGSVFPLGDTQVWCYARDSINNTSLGIFTVHVVDTTPPALTVPANKAVDASLPAGATVAYTVEAIDAVDAAPTIVCIPSSGATFASGDSTVDCTATDASLNVGRASFVVHVRGAGEQLVLLTTAVQALGLPYGTENSLLVKLGAGQLAPFVHEVQAQSGKAIPVAAAADLVARAERIEAVLG